MAKLVLMMKKAGAYTGLVQKEVIVHGKGKTFTRKQWVRASEAGNDDGGAKGAAEAAKERGSRSGGRQYGMHNIEAGDKVTFETPEGETMSGKVESAGKDGVMANGHPVFWKDIRGFTPKKGTKAPEYNDRYFNKKKEFIEPESFTASQWKKQFDDGNATAESVLNSFSSPDAIKKAIAETEDRLKHLEETITWHRKEGKDDKAVYNPDRQRRHVMIVMKFLSPYKMRMAKPKKGEKPKLIMLGGRGGSGKSWFEGKVYDPKRTIALDADKVKALLPEYEGWNAQQVHEESSDLIEQMLAMALENGLNVVLDATMKTAKSAVRKAEAAKSWGYEIEAHYMHLPRQEAAKRAVSRFMGKTKRYVPAGYVLENTTNEESFDIIKEMADRWSFRDNNVPMDQEPILISEKK